MTIDTLRAMLGELGDRVRLRDGSMRAHVASGKLARGRIVANAAALGPERDEALVMRYASAVELIHAGALCHDDLVDRSATRRARPTVWYTVGARASLVAGLDLILRGVAQIAREPATIRRTVARATRRLARGQTDEYEDRFAVDVSPARYLRRAADKTGALYELAGLLGGTAGGLDRIDVRALGTYGAELGIAFQLLDDLRDLVGGPSLGREVGTDVREGVYTLPVLLTLAGAHPGADRLARRLEDDASDATVAAIVELLRGNGAIEATAACAADRLHRALDALDVFEPCPARAMLSEIARELVGTTPRACRHAPDDASPLPGGRRPAAPPVGVSIRDAGSAFWQHLPPAACGGAAWPRAAAGVVERAGALLELADRLTDGRPDDPDTWADAAGVTAAAHALTVDAVGALALIPPTVAEGIVQAILRRFEAAGRVIATGQGRGVTLGRDALDALHDDCGTIAAEAW